MPRYATVFADLTCPSCHEHVDDRLEVQWGRIPAAYRLGDAVKWRRDAKGRIVEPFTLRPGQDSWNCGDPAARNALLLDVNAYRSELKPRCPRCNVPLDGGFVRVVNGRFAEARLLLEGELVTLVGRGRDIDCNIFVVADDGTIDPRPDWTDKEIRSIP
jgi:hypothetical protein